VDPEELSEIAVDSEAIRVLKRLAQDPPQKKSGYENEWIKIFNWGNTCLDRHRAH